MWCDGIPSGIWNDNENSHKLANSNEKETEEGQYSNNFKDGIHHSAETVISIKIKI